MKNAVLGFSLVSLLGTTPLYAGGIHNQCECIVRGEKGKIASRYSKRINFNNYLGWVPDENGCDWLAKACHGICQLYGIWPSVRSRIGTESRSFIRYATRHTRDTIDEIAGKVSSLRLRNGVLEGPQRSMFEVTSIVLKKGVEMSIDPGFPLWIDDFSSMDQQWQNRTNPRTFPNIYSKENPRTRIDVHHRCHDGDGSQRRRNFHLDLEVPTLVEGFPHKEWLAPDPFELDMNARDPIDLRILLGIAGAALLYPPAIPFVARMAPLAAHP